MPPFAALPFKGIHILDRCWEDHNLSVSLRREVADLFLREFR